MIIQPIDSKFDLYEVVDFIDTNLLNRINLQDLLSLSYTKETWQEQYNRRRLKDNDLLLQISDYIKSKLPQIIDITKMPVDDCTTGFWLDGPGFIMHRHIDNSNVFATMQIYLTDNPDLPGTKFTTECNQNRYTFLYQKNKGYLMINNINQYHEVAGAVPDSCYRLTSYTWFFPKI